MAVFGVATKKGFYARVGYFLFGGMVMTFNLLGLAAGEGGMAEIMSVGMFACQTIIMYPWVPEEVDFSHEALRTGAGTTADYHSIHHQRNCNLVDSYNA